MLRKRFISDEWKLNKKGHENYEFVDVAINDDNLLFIDPCLIENAVDAWSIKAAAHMTDSETMLFKMVHFWIPGFSKGVESEMEYLCKSSIEKWYKDKFIAAKTNQDGERVVYSKEQIINKILEASAFLDYELMSAFLLELYLKKYQYKMAKRFKKIQRESQYNLS